MGLAVLAFTTQLESLECASCGVTFAAPAALIRRARERERGVSVFCPNGHQNVWHETEIDRLRKQLALREAELNGANNTALLWRTTAKEAERKLIAQKGANTKLKRRVKAGVCPCCHRTFKQLSAHMAMKHPTFAVATDDDASTSGSPK